ncbi:zf-HC2 domain-containing protein [Frankia sp. AgB1.9]|uniref:zf-HC2 domain-containing protein n=1 Tax=unclassified Frankia TaxID=2632575 RepID=UPI0019317991|nr:MULTISPECIES: zf-HC2 domain-containing protein [unclassified Frankia]MBL7487523.1 zf-HC2 domain-containing protein [Frankia sp. AgW1.1]MBL7549494.1 zf-HC2 domain-containing protein [Frankia sp. AgB1.9]MBL7620717.1 zf-HC2 domain-containing protein [Frankia sp. AgB1.8]
MDCNLCREALSARIDGEVEHADPAAVEEHLRGCASCLAWQDRAVSLTRSLRLGPAVATPDFTTAILDAHAQLPQPALAALRPRLRRSRSRERSGARGLDAASGSSARLALLLVGWLQIGLGLLQLLDNHGFTGHHVTAQGTSSEHLFNESVAWTVGAGVAMFWAAVQPRRAAGLLVALAGAVLVLGGFSAYDLLVSSVQPARVATHVVLLAGLGLAYAVDRAYQAGTPSPGRPSRRHPNLKPHTMPAARPEAIGHRGHGGGTPLRPAGRRHAA